jgi:hypothetical protein
MSERNYFFFVRELTCLAILSSINIVVDFIAKTPRYFYKYDFAI